jgi:hypothetical protein
VWLWGRAVLKGENRECECCEMVANLCAGLGPFRVRSLGRTFDMSVQLI